jgi:hypothetical protein
VIRGARGNNQIIKDLNLQEVAKPMENNIKHGH